MVQSTRATSAVSSSRTAVASTPVITIPPEAAPAAPSDDGTDSLIISEIRNLSREISALKSAN